MPTTPLATATESHRFVATQHEIAHALAFIAHDRPFECVEVDEFGAGIVRVAPGSRVSQNIRAKICMAGPAAELEYQIVRVGEESAVADLVGSWNLLLDLELPDEDGTQSDEARAGGHLGWAAAWGMAFFRANRELIDDVATRLIGAGGYLTYDAVVELAEDAIDDPDEQVMVHMLSLFSGYSESIKRVEAHLEELHAQ